MRQPVYLIYDIGKTNKKCLVFSEAGIIIDEYTERFEETVDEDGFPCEDVIKLKEWVLGQYELLLAHEQYRIVGINFATYGASFVHVDKEGEPITPIYNYLKPLPKQTADTFLQTHFNGSAATFALQTSSPFMGMLNSGLQLYWLKDEQPKLWAQIKHSLHLPQYLSFLFTGKAVSDYTSVGCHTGLWDAETKSYHAWVRAEGLDKKLPPITQASIAAVNEKGILIGTGLHDSSSALIPHLQQHAQPFLLISTGTWCINLNPFNHEPLQVEELAKDALCYLQADGLPVKASRIFLGKEHEVQTERIAAHFNKPPHFYKQITTAVHSSSPIPFIPHCMEGSGPQPQKQSGEWGLDSFASAEEAYAALMQGLLQLLKQSIDLVLTPEVKHLYIDGGFAANPLFKKGLQGLYPQHQIEVMEIAQATALGAFLQMKKVASVSV